jgi:hypothetical protein
MSSRRSKAAAIGRKSSGSAERDRVRAVKSPTWPCQPACRRPLSFAAAGAQLEQPAGACRCDCSTVTSLRQQRAAAHGGGSCGSAPLSKSAKPGPHRETGAARLCFDARDAAKQTVLPSLSCARILDASRPASRGAPPSVCQRQRQAGSRQPATPASGRAEAVKKWRKPSTVDLGQAFARGSCIETFKIPLMGKWPHPRRRSGEPNCCPASRIIPKAVAGCTRDTSSQRLGAAKPQPRQQPKRPASGYGLRAGRRRRAGVAGCRRSGCRRTRTGGGSTCFRRHSRSRLCRRPTAKFVVVARSMLFAQPAQQSRLPRL